MMFPHVCVYLYLYSCMVVSIQHNVISRTLVGAVLPLGKDAVGVFYCPSQQGNSHICMHECFVMHIYIYIYIYTHEKFIVK